MCGIAGIYAYHPKSDQANRNELRLIRDHMRARGPDGKGEWYSDDGRLALGHRRLSIIDLSERGAQPMSSADGKLVITYNGEIYNYRALRQDLETKGHSFRSDSDTEVLLHLYAEKGEAMVHDLRGMFAFGLWDASKRALLLARDPYGIKPLYWSDDGRTLRIASQVKALIAGGAISRDPDPAGIVGFYLFGSVPEPYTTYSGIRELPAGSYLMAKERGVADPVKYFSVAEVFAAGQSIAESAGADELAQRVREALTDSVRHHMVADVPVGAFLSAGVDSGTLVGLMSEMLSPSPLAGEGRGAVGQQDAVRTITLAFEEYRGKQHDESPLAEKVARRYGTAHTTGVVSERDFKQHLPAILEAMDQPSIDGINTWFVSKAAREQGLKVAVSGLGGDELFGGYPAFKDVPRWVSRFSTLSAIPGLGSTLRHLFTGVVRWLPSVSPKAGGLVEYGGTYPGAYLLRRGLFMPWELPALVGEDRAREGLLKLRPLDHIERTMEPDPKQPFARVAAMEASLYMRNQLLRDSDWAGMSHSLEIRLPLVDATLLRALGGLFARSPEFDGKRLMGLSPLRPLPAHIIERPKTGFTVPTGRWVERVERLGDWRRIPMLRRDGCHWSRRLAYVLGAELV